MKGRGTATIVIIIILSSASILISSTILMQLPLKAQQQQQQQDQQPIVMRIQNTSMSEPAPNAPLNNQTLPHQIVVALPIRHDGKIWTGTVTFTASKPIEVEVEHKYNRYNATIDAKHGEPYHAKWFDGTNIALSTMTMFTNTPVAVTNTPISTGSFTFTGSALVFHKTDGVPFTVTYTLDAVANPLTPPSSLSNLK
jgi:Na+-transporting NADH:ubiquinone oxidoreductase subunit NqrC